MFPSERTAWSIPSSSSAVSPFARMAMTNAVICEGVASPRSISEIADSAMREPTSLPWSKRVNRSGQPMKSAEDAMRQVSPRDGGMHE